jgi:hypothetical protein
MRPRQPLGRDRRAQSSGFIVFVLIIGISALLWGLADPAATDIFNYSLNATNNAEAEGIINERATIWANALFFTVLFGGTFIIARAVVQSRR